MRRDTVKLWGNVKEVSIGHLGNITAAGAKIEAGGQESLLKT